MRDILFTWHPRAWTARFFSPETTEIDWNDPGLEIDVAWADPDETWVEQLDTAFVHDIPPGLAWDTLQEVAQVGGPPGPVHSPGTAVAIREPHPVATAIETGPVRHSHRRKGPRTPRRNRRGTPAAFAWLDAVDARMAAMDRRMGVTP
jgi:hypothetical protein